MHHCPCVARLYRSNARSRLSECFTIGRGYACFFARSPVPGCRAVPVPNAGCTGRLGQTVRSGARDWGCESTAADPRPCWSQSPICRGWMQKCPSIRCSMKYRSPRRQSIKEVLGQERRHHHASAVVHPSVLVQLAHRSVDDGVSCFALAPGLELILIVFPLDVGEFGLETLVHAEGEDHTSVRNGRKLLVLGRHRAI